MRPKILRQKFGKYMLCDAYRYPKWKNPLRHFPENSSSMMIHSTANYVVHHSIYKSIHIVNYEIFSGKWRREFFRLRALVSQRLVKIISFWLPKSHWKLTEIKCILAFACISNNVQKLDMRKFGKMFHNTYNQKPKKKNTTPFSRKYFVNADPPHCALRRAVLFCKNISSMTKLFFREKGVPFFAFEHWCHKQFFVKCLYEFFGSQNRI